MSPTGTSNEVGRAAPRLPPVALTLLVAGLMWAAARWAPAWRIAVPARELMAAGLLLLGGAVGIAGLRAFHRARTTSNPLQPERASALVTTGIYRHTRNPMYVALALALMAWAVWLGHAAAPLGIVAYFAWMDRLQIPPEERALRALFGEEFARYCRGVRRWI